MMMNDVFLLTPEHRKYVNILLLLLFAYTILPRDKCVCFCVHVYIDQWTLQATFELSLCIAVIWSLVTFIGLYLPSLGVH